MATTLPAIPVPAGQKRRLRDDELPTLVFIGEETNIPLRVELEAVHRAMKGETGKTLTAPDFFTGKTVHVRCASITAALKAVETTDLRRR